MPEAGVTPPAVSVVIATCNQATTLPETLRCLRTQTLAPHRWELLIIDDGSTDETAEILRRDAGWAQVVRQENRGLPAACNTGLGLARGRYLARMDSDDSAAPDWLERMTDALEAAPDASCAVPDRFETDGRTHRLVRSEPDNLYSLIACGTLFRTKLLRSIGGYRPFYWEEYDLYLRLRPMGSFLHVRSALYTYRKHAGAMTQSREARHRGWRELASVWGEQALRSAGPNPDLEEALR